MLTLHTEKVWTTVVVGKLKLFISPWQVYIILSNKGLTNIPKARTADSDLAKIAIDIKFKSMYRIYKKITQNNTLFLEIMLYFILLTSP